MNRFSINTWSLHERLGPSRMARVSGDGDRIIEVVQPHPEEISLFELPYRLAERGIGAVDICYFHFPRTDEAYLDRLREALAGAGVALFSLLIDFGNLTRPASRARDLELAHVADWVRRAGYLGAKCARAVAGAGDPKDPQAMEQAVRGYAELADVAAEAGVRLLTENLGSFACGPATILPLLERLEGRLGLCVDFGNGRRSGQYDELRRLLPHAESIHAKPELTATGALDAADFRRCVAYAEEAGFSGPYTIVYRGPKDPWAGIAEVRDLILAEIEPES